MAKPGFLLVSLSVFLLLNSSKLPQTVAQGAPSPSPSPSPSPGYVNLTHILSFAGPFSTFLGYLSQTHVIDTFQNQANSSAQGITVFVPTDEAFSSQKRPSLSNLTQDQLRSLLLFHALPQFYSLEQFKNLSRVGNIATFAGGQYALNFTYDEGLVRVSSGWVNPMISSSIFSTPPVALYQVKRVLLPEAIFGAAPPVAPAPAPSDGKPSDSDPAAGSGSTAASPTTGSVPGENAAPRRSCGGAVVGLFFGLMIFW
ncbi:FASCICLIN-like arabinoogalactan 7 [Wolffia australiana]